MKRNLMGLFLFLGLFAFVLATPAAKIAFALPVNEIIWQQDTNFAGTLAAGFQTSIDTSASTITFVLSNTSSYTNPGDFPSTVILTGFGFNLPENYSITGGSISGQTTQGYVDGQWNQYWGYDNITGNDGGPFVNLVSHGSVNSVVSTLAAAVDSPLNNTLLSGWGGIIDGPNHGALISGESADQWDYFLGSATISLYYSVNGSPVADLQSFIESNHTVASFGSPASPVPEPATMLLLGTGLIGLAGFGRKKLLK